MKPFKMIEITVFKNIRKYYYPTTSGLILRIYRSLEKERTKICLFSMFSQKRLNRFQELLKLNKKKP